MNLDFKRTNETWSHFRRRVSRLASTANKRLQRLEKNDVRDTQAYRSVTAYKGTQPRFGVKGKSNNEVISEFWRLNRFLQARTSTIKGIRSVLAEAERNTGGKFSGSLSEQVIQAGDYFKVVDVITDYLKNVEQSAIALNYNAIFNAVSKAIRTDKNILAGLRSDGESLKNLLQSTLNDLGISAKEDIENALSKEFSRRINITL